MSMVSRERIVALVAGLYEMVVRIHQLPAESIQFPPHALEARWYELARNELHLSENTIKLLESLPYLRKDTALNYMSRSVNYLNPGTLLEIRDPIGNSQALDHAPEDPANIGDDDIALTTFAHRDGTIFYLNTVTGAITEFSPAQDVDGRVYPTASSEEVVAKLMQELRELSVTPWDEEKFWLTPRTINSIAEARQLECLSLAVKALFHECGWPDAFRADEFRARRNELEREEWPFDTLELY